MQNNDYIKDADGNPVYSNTATFTCTVPKADELKVITGLTNYKTNINGFYFRFDPTLDTEKDDYESKIPIYHKTCCYRERLQWIYFQI